VVRSNRTNIIAEIDCDACSKTHEAELTVISGSWTALKKKDGSSRSSTVSCDLPYTCPCTDKKQTATVELERPEGRDIRDVSLNRWKSTGCEDH
jgi:hypothetical protein